MSRLIALSFCVALLLRALPVAYVAQQAPAAEDKPKTYASYEALFDDFAKRREVLYTRFERLQENERVAPADLERVEEEIRSLDGEYARALRAYVEANADAADLMPARFEIVNVWSRLEDRLEQAVASADDFLRLHADAELAPDVRFLKAQTLFRISEEPAELLREAPHTTAISRPDEVRAARQSVMSAPL